MFCFPTHSTAVNCITWYHTPTRTPFTSFLTSFIWCQMSGRTCAVRYNKSSYQLHQLHANALCYFHGLVAGRLRQLDSRTVKLASLFRDTGFSCRNCIGTNSRPNCCCTFNEIRTRILGNNARTLKTGSSGEVLRKLHGTVGFHKTWAIFRLAKQLSSYQ